MREEQRQFIEFWYWSSIFANRYSTSSNETTITVSQTIDNYCRVYTASRMGCTAHPLLPCAIALGDAFRRIL